MAEVTYFVALPFVATDDGVAAGKSPHCCGLFCITNRGIHLRRSRRLRSDRHNHNPVHNRHSTAAERSRSMGGNYDSHSGGSHNGDNHSGGSADHAS
jgi:hypothetical protein